MHIRGELQAHTVTDGKQNIAYLRGRKLYGKTVKLPQGYYGAVASRQKEKKDDDRPTHEDETSLGDNDGDSEQATPMAALRSEGVFDEFVVWGHESVADASADAHVRGIEEWIGFAEKV